MYLTPLGVYLVDPIRSICTCSNASSFTGMLYRLGGTCNSGDCICGWRRGCTSPKSVCVFSMQYWVKLWRATYWRVVRQLSIRGNLQIAHLSEVQVGYVSVPVAPEPSQKPNPTFLAEKLVASSLNVNQNKATEKKMQGPGGDPWGC